MRRIAIILIFSLLANLNIGCERMKRIKYNNDMSKDELLTKSYSDAQIDDLKDAVNNSTFTYSALTKMFDVQCTRKTHQGYYVILFQDDKEIYVFFDDKLEFYHLMVAESFTTRKDFESSIEVGMKKSDVSSFNTANTPIPGSAVDTNVCYVDEGVFLIKYTREKKGALLEDPEIKTIDFIDNEALLSLDDTYIYNVVPYILEVDKIS